MGCRGDNISQWSAGLGRTGTGMRVEFDEGEREGKHDENFIVLKIAAACLYPDGLHSIALILEA